MQHLQDELDDNGTYQATRNDLTNKMRAIAVQVVELSGTNVVMDRAEMENIPPCSKNCMTTSPIPTTFCEAKPVIGAT